MLTKFLFSPRRNVINYMHRCISTSSARWQSTDLMESKTKFDAVNIPEKKPGRAPLVKNFMLAVVDNELIPYPEAFIEPQYSNQAKLNQESYADFLKTNVFVNPKDANNLEKLKEFGSFSCHQKLTTERLFSLEEPEAEKLSYGQFLSNHRTVGEIIEKLCDEQMKQKYLTKLSSGELMGVVCLTEKTPPQVENRPFNTYGTENDEETFTIKGEKSFVLLNELESSLMLVAVTVESTDRLGDFEEKIGLFLVEGNTPGVSILQQHETTGLEEGPFRRVTVKFDKVEVPRRNLLSDELPASINLLNHLRINVGVLAVSGIMRPLINKMSDYFINTRIQHLFYKDIDIMKEYVGKLASTCYALESMIYYTAALKDIYEGQDIDVECATIKNFAVQTLCQFITAPIFTVGPHTTFKSEGYDKLIRDAIQVCGIEEPIETLKQFIALNGMNHAGKGLNEQIRKERNILDHPAFVFSRARKEINIRTPKLKMNLWHDLHESARPAAMVTEASIYRCRAIVEILLARFGPQIFLQSVECGYIADITTLCYAMFASVSRASRAYCIGLKNGDQEIFLANAFCVEASERVRNMAIMIDESEHMAASHVYKELGQKLMENKKYHMEHPTTRNF